MGTRKSLGVVSGKGGVGKTTTVANLGVIMAKEFGLKTLVVDANLLTANLGIHLGLLYPPVTLTDCLKGDISVKKVVYPHSSGLSIIPSSIAAGEKLSENLLKKCVEPIKDRFDYIIFDSSPGLSKETIAVVNASDELIVITTPDLPAVSDTAKTIKLAEELGVVVRGLLVNRVENKKYELSLDEIEETCGYKIIAVIPEDDKVPESIAFKTPLALYSPNSNAAKAFRNMAIDITGMQPSGKAAVLTPNILQRVINFILRK